jgi:hypothetical protein
VRDDVPVDSATFLVTDFMNLKIKSAQSFIRVSDHTYINIICNVFLKKNKRVLKPQAFWNGAGAAQPGSGQGGVQKILESQLI